MPYTGANDPKIPSNVPKSKRKMWVSVWNNVYKTCKKKGGTTTSCETKAFKTANAAIKK